MQALEPVEFHGPVWRIVRQGRDPLLASRSGGRWDDGTFDGLQVPNARHECLNIVLFDGVCALSAKTIIESHGSVDVVNT